MILNLNARTIVSKALGYAGMALLVLLIGLPIAWLVTGSFKTNPEILTITPKLLPERIHFGNFVEAWQSAPFGRYYVNSIWTTLLGAGAEVILAVTTAYALVFVRFPFRNAVFVLLLVALMVPEQVVIVPNYLTLAAWHPSGPIQSVLLTLTEWPARITGGVWPPRSLVNTYAGIFLPGASIALGTFLLRQYFRTIPLDLTDAARVDGAGHFRTMLSIIVPVAMPAVATTALLSFTAKWNEYLWPLIITSTDSMRTLTTGISRLQDAEGNAQFGVLMAGALFVVIPVVIVFLFAQRFVVEGIAAGAVKG